MIRRPLQTHPALPPSGHPEPLHGHNALLVQEPYPDTNCIIRVAITPSQRSMAQCPVCWDSSMYQTVEPMRFSETCRVATNSTFSFFLLLRHRPVVDRSRARRDAWTGKGLGWSKTRVGEFALPMCMYGASHIW